MEREPRPEKAAVVEEVRGKLEAADATILTEYRGLTVAELKTLRRSISADGGEYKVYKNTLVRRAAESLDLDFGDLLTGPTGVAFVAGDIAKVAKSLNDFAKANPNLIVKGGLLGENVLDGAGAKALASLPTASEVYSRLAGALNGPARSLAGVTQGVHRSIAYVLQAAIDAGAFGGAAPEASATTSDDTPAETASATTEEN